MSRPINKEWMNERNRVGPVYTKGVEDFLEFANTNNDRLLTTIPCPCVKCRNGKRQKPLDVRKHLVRHGIYKLYTVWVLHGENPSMNSIDHPPIEDVHEENIEVGFEFNVPPAVARKHAEKSRKHAEKSWSQKLRSYKNTLRPLLNNAESANLGPKGVDPIIWSAFAKIESEPKKEQKVQNANNWKNVEFSHCLGRCSYAQKQHLMQQQNYGKPICRVDKWLIGRDSDGTVLESAKSKHDEVIAAKNKRKDRSGEGCCDTFEDLDNDELAEVFGKDKKGRVRAVGSHVSKKQLIHIGVAKSKIEGMIMANEQSASLKDELFTHVDSKIADVDSKLESMKGMLVSIISKLSNNAGSPPLVTTPSTSIGSNSVNRPTHLSQNLDNVFATMGVPHVNNSMPTPTDKPPVILLDKFGKELAKGYVVTDATSKVCHFKQVGMGEKKVYIEEVYEPDARLCDPPQGGYDTLAGFIEGGFVIWLECWLRYV